MKNFFLILTGIVKTGFSNFNAEKMLDKARAAIKALTNNDNFPAPEPDLLTI